MLYCRKCRGRISIRKGTILYKCDKYIDEFSDIIYSYCNLSYTQKGASEMIGITEKNTSVWYSGIRLCIDYFMDDRDNREPTIGRFGPVETDETNVTQKVFISYIVSLFFSYL